MVSDLLRLSRMKAQRKSLAFGALIDKAISEKCEVTNDAKP